MDDFNFFDDQRNNNHDQDPQRPYHSPEPKKDDNGKKNVATLCIILSVVMCVVIIVNVVVLASLKTTIANEYSKKLTEITKSEYYDAINDILDDSDILNDVKDAAATKAASALSTSIGSIANAEVAPSVARIFLYKEATDTNYSGLASAFLITDSTSGSHERYLVTNAHCARYLKTITTIVNNGFWGPQTSITGFEWKSFGKVIGYFEGDDTAYTMQIVSYGSFDGADDTQTYYSQYYNIPIPKDNDQADLAILKIVGANQPSNEEHKSLKIASHSNPAVRGDEVALIGNPEGVGGKTSIAAGIVSQTGISIASWGSGKFIMTDAAINGGNSGGPMINKNAVVVGVVESKLVSTDIDNMGFAIDAETLVNFMNWSQTTYSITIPYTLV